MTDATGFMKSYRILRHSDGALLYEGDSDTGINGILVAMRDAGITIDGLVFSPLDRVKNAHIRYSENAETKIITLRVSALYSLDSEEYKAEMAFVYPTGINMLIHDVPPNFLLRGGGEYYDI